MPTPTEQTEAELSDVVEDGICILQGLINARLTHIEDQSLVDQAAQKALAALRQLKEQHALLQNEVANLAGALDEGECVWTYDDYALEWGWCGDTACGNRYCLNDGTPIASNMPYCPFCGKRIREAEDE